ncbi:hypothetical protein V3C99_012904 [Haemonchus contortus]|uniref:Uncharacterized protein n=1 Tax=Haemonchus contortus TaxID=6289 RepID=A0A7I5E746_HAECO
MVAVAEYENINNPAKDLPPPPSKNKGESPYENVDANVDLLKVLEEMESLESETKSGDRMSKEKESKDKEKAAPRTSVSMEQKSKEGKVEKKDMGRKREDQEVDKTRPLIDLYRFIFVAVFILWLVAALFIVLMAANAAKMIDIL